ncbi:MAG: GT4 family glycosyltransferase PelF [Coxiellaceae bacterium]|nr:GT4 family glycosyltransferase PelF [Coxiellaceae bacterium]
MVDTSHLPTASSADIALFVEGAYPLVTGGVSSWVHQIISAYPDIQFALIFIGSKEEDYTEIKYQLPDNVVHVEIHYLFDGERRYKPKPCPGKPKAFSQIRDLHVCFKGGGEEGELEDIFSDLSFYIDPKQKVDEKQFLFSRESWRLIVDMYKAYSAEPSFLDYFWTVRNVHQPLWGIADIVNDFIKVKALHTVSTGYAGFLASLVNKQYGYPLVLTEHGIYAKERRIEMLSSTVVKNVDPLIASPIEPSYLRHIWIRFFECLARVCYGASTNILSLYGGAQAKQIEDGADPKKTEVIANGVDVLTLKNCRHPVDFSGQLTMALVGRVVPIKDIKTYIRAVKIVSDKTDHIQAWIVGPQDEDEEYVEECKELVTTMGLAEIVQFTGLMKMTDVLSTIDLMVLSSISEGMPLTVLEAYAAGLPVVVTDVGACRELVQGFDEETRAIPPAGEVVSIANPNDLANGIIKMLSDEEHYKACQAAAIVRAEKFFDERIMLARYRDIYEQAMTACQV